MKGLNIGNYHKDHSDLPNEWRHELDLKNARKQAEIKNKELERQEIDSKVRGFNRHNTVADQKQLSQASKEQYRQELSKQIQTNKLYAQGDAKGGISLELGPGQSYNKEEFKRGLDKQLEEKNLSRKEQLYKSKLDDLNHLQQIQSSRANYSSDVNRNQNELYKSQLAAQREEDRARLTNQKKQEDLLALNDHGLPIGNYNPDYKEYLASELQKQIQDKNAQKDQEKAQKQHEENERLRKYKQAESAAKLNQSYQFKPDYKSELDHQNEELRTLKEQNRLQQIKEERNQTGLPLGQYNPDYREELKRGLDQQVNEKAKLSQKQKQYEQEGDRQRLDLITRAMSADPRRVDKDNLARYKVELDEQAKSNNDLKQLLAQQQRLEEKNQTGLNIGNYKSYDRNLFRQGLEEQIDQAKRQNMMQQQENLESELKRLSFIRQAENEYTDPHQIERGLTEQLRSGLDEQVHQNSIKKNAERNRDVQEELNQTGLPLGRYNPNYKEELISTLNEQIKHKRAQQAAEKEQKIAFERELLNRIEEAKRQHDPKLAAKYERDLKNGYFDELKSQIYNNKIEKEAQSKLEKDKERNHQGLPLGLYNPDYREELKRGLDRQVEEKQFAESRRKQQKLEDEQNIIRLQQKQGSEFISKEEQTQQQAYVADLKEQALKDSYRKQQEKAYFNTQDAGLQIGDYKGYDKQDLIDYLQKQIQEKKTQASKNKQANQLKDIEEAQMRLSALRNTQDLTELNKRMQEEFRRQLDEQRLGNERLNEARTRKELEEERNQTGLKLGLYRPDYKDELRESLLRQMEADEAKKSQAKKRERSEDNDRLRQIEEAARQLDPIKNNDEFYRDLAEQVAQNKESAERARRQELEELANSVGLNIGNYKGYDKDEFRKYLNRQIAEKEEAMKASKVALVYLQSWELRNDLQRMKDLRSKVNQSEEIQQLDQRNAKDRLKDQKKSDYERFMEEKEQKQHTQKQQDREYVELKSQEDWRQITDQKARNEVNLYQSRL